jgi:hypothetical protein
MNSDNKSFLYWFMLKWLDAVPREMYLEDINKERAAYDEMTGKELNLRNMMSNSLRLSQEIIDGQQKAIKLANQIISGHEENMARLLEAINK